MKNATETVESTKTGPNDARRVVWTVVSNFIFLRIFLMLIDIFTEYIYSINEKCDKEEGNDENGPKRRAFGIVWALGEHFFIFFIFLILIDVFTEYIAFIDEK